jgi:endonuclease/exonuclease/phosphatase family metal-dependent hydrolase
MISNLEKEWQIDIQSEAFNTCSGWLGGLNDCFATKGLQLARIKTPSGKYLHILNTHLDAGRDTSDLRARAEQLNQILAKVKKEIPGEALIVAGDLNLRRNDPEDSSLLEAFMEDLDLTDSVRGVHFERGWPVLDYILYRNGRNINLEVLEVGEDTDFQSEKGPLSDHPALFIRLLIY